MALPFPKRFEMQRIASSQPLHPLKGTQATRVLEHDLATSLGPYTLMARAGAAVARLAVALAPHSRVYWIWAGPGNNGGDGLEAARQLHLAGHSVGVTLAASAERLPADAQQALARAQAAGVCIQSDPPSRQDALADSVLWIDALLGLGLESGARELSPALENSLAALRRHRGPVLSVDVPSGLDADTGVARPWTVPATATASLLTLKPGLFTGQGRDCVGDIWWDDLAAGTLPLPPDAWLSSDSPRLVRRHSQHKGSFGDVTIVGGAAGMTGAALLAAAASQAAGAGRVFVHLLAAAASAGEPLTPVALDPTHPALMFRPWDGDSRPAAWAQHTVACGCGGGDAVVNVLPRLLESAARLILDADALNAVATSPVLQRQLSRRAQKGLSTVLTPHPLEAARLLGVETIDIQNDRRGAAQRIAQAWQCVVVLKGAGTVIASPDAIPWINLPGNAALATAGTGDVLTGWMAGWWAQSLGSVGEANHLTVQAVAAQAVAWHGAAAEPMQSGALRAEDLIERMHKRLRAT